jgi:arylsulfatase A-like enzyme
MQEYSRRDFLQKAGLLGMAGATLCCGCAESRQPVSRRTASPNLLFVFSDQQSRDMLGCYGNKSIRTPNLDRLASEGLQFEHCVSSSPVCTPFRGMLISGQHPLYSGVLHNDVPLLANNGKYFGHVLTEAGYRTGYIGKWHLLGGDRNRPVPAGKMRYGFDDVFLTNNCHVNYRPGKCFYWNEQGEKVFFAEWEVYGQTRQAMEFLDECSEEEPFALFVSWHPPHDIGLDPKSLVFRYDTEPELMAMYDPDQIKLRPNVKDTPEVRKAYHGHYAMCTGVDIAFGRLMDKLKEKGLDDNTIVVFTTDHGDNLTSYDYHIAKDHPEDTASRIPFLMRWPKALPSGHHRDLLLGPMDMMPTLLGLMGLEVPATVQGQNLAKAVLAGDDDAVESVPMFFFYPSWRGVYTRDVTYGFGELRHFAHDDNGGITFKNVPVRALYDRRNDPDQLNNLFDDETARPLRERMEKLTQQWLDRFGDPGWRFSLEDINKTYRMPNGQWPEDAQEAGFPGRPIDLIAAGKTKHNGHKVG